MSETTLPLLEMLKIIITMLYHYISYPSVSCHDHHSDDYVILCLKQHCLVASDFKEKYNHENLHNDDIDENHCH